MSRGFLGWAAAAFAVGIFVAVVSEDDDAPQAPGAVPAAGGTPGAGGLSYALDAARSNWPALDESSPPPVPADQQTRVNYYIVLDGSGSMRSSECSGGRTKIEAAVAALQSFTQSIPDEQNMGLAAFDNQGLSERVPLADRKRVAMAQALATVQAGGGTPLRSAIALGFEQLTVQARRQLGYGEYHLVVVTDGHPEPASEDPADVVDRLLRESPVQLHTVGFCIGEDHVLNQPGRVFYAAADNPEQLRQGLETVLAESPGFDVSRFGQ